MHIYVYVNEFIYVTGFKFFKTDDEFEVRDFAKLQIVETVDEIKVGTLRGARDPQNCQRNQCSEVSRSS